MQMTGTASVLTVAHPIQEPSLLPSVFSVASECLEMLMSKEHDRVESKDANRRGSPL